MEEAIALFKQVYEQHRSTEFCTAEVKRKSFSQLRTVEVLMDLSTISLVEADEVVRNSVAWTN